MEFDVFDETAPDATIYGLIADDGSTLYVGSTVCMSSRIRCHRERRQDCGSRNIPVTTNWVAVILETCSREIRAVREQYWQDTLLPQFNLIRAVADKNVIKAQWRKASAKYRDAHRNPKLPETSNTAEQDPSNAETV
jgi:hypothetical protein